MAHARFRKGRDSALLASLPPKDSPYSFDNLSQTETDALEAAFGDGFGNVGSVGHEAQPLPKEVRSGLLRHSYFARDFSEYDHEEFPDEFWESVDGEQPGAFESFPLGFVLRRLRLYFGN